MGAGGLVFAIDPLDKICYPGTGTTAKSLAFYSNTDATLTNANIGTTEANVFSFDSSQYITVPDGDAFTWGTGPFALEQWLYFTDFTPDGDGWNTSFQIYRVEADRLGMFLFYSSGGGFEWRLECSSNGAYPAIIDLVAQGVAINEWHYYAISRQSENSLKQYLDGELIQEMTTADGGTTPRGTTYDTTWPLTEGTVYIGNYASGDPHEFEGKMGPTRVWRNGALTDAQVRENFRTERHRFGV